MSNKKQKRQQRQTQKRRKQQKQQQQQGGMSTSEWGVKTFGDMGQQNAVPGSNVLQVHSMAGGKGLNFPSAPGSQGPQLGGTAPVLTALLNPEVVTPVVLTLASNAASKRLGRTQKQRGGNLTNVAVPAVLVLASNMLSKRLRKTKKQ